MTVSARVVLIHRFARFHSARATQLLLGLTTLLSASAALAFSVPFSGEMAIGGYVRIPSSGPFSGDTVADVQYSGTNLESLELPPGEFYWDVDITEQAPPEAWPVLSTHGSLHTQTNDFRFEQLSSSTPSVSVSFWNNSIGAIPWSAGFTTAFWSDSVSLDPNLIGTTATREYSIGVPPVAFHYRAHFVPWSVDLVTSNRLVASSMGPLECDFTGWQVCGYLGATLDVTLGLDPFSQVGFGPGIGSTRLLGGSSTPGGFDMLLEVASGDGLLDASFDPATRAEIEALYASLPFALPGFATSFWQIDGGHQFNGVVELTFGYDPALLPSGFDESQLAIAHYTGTTWELLRGAIDPGAHTITVQTTSFSPFALVAVPESETALLIGIGLLLIMWRNSM